MTPLRAKCPNKDICGQTGHTIEGGVVKRCQCLELEINQRRLGPMFTPNPKVKTNLATVQDQDLAISGTLEGIRQHASRVLIARADAGQEWVTIDAYRLIDIFLGQDSDFASQTAVTETDLLILLLGFGDPRNKYLPELILQVLSRRELNRKPTWCVLGVTIDQLHTKYSTPVFERINRMKKVNVAS